MLPLFQSSTCRRREITITETRLFRAMQLAGTGFERRSKSRGRESGAEFVFEHYARPWNRAENLAFLHTGKFQRHAGLQSAHHELLFAARAVDLAQQPKRRA